MWRFLQLLGICALIISGEGKRYHEDSHTFPIQPRNGGDFIPSTVQVSHYKIDLEVTADDLTKATFSGVVEINLRTYGSMSSFPVHAKEIEILTVTLKDNNGKAVTTTHSGLDTLNDFLTITSAGTIPDDDYTLTITYKGKLSETDMNGFYKSTYKDAKGDTKMLATTQFKPFGARKAFPCFDEPARKATFDLSITYPDGYHALHNTAPTGDPVDADNGLKKVTFETSPLMSTYLIAFTVSEFSCLNGNDTFDIPTQVCARPGTEATMETARNTAPLSLAAMKTYTNFDYKDIISKLSQAAIPDFAAGSMENWGMVTYREANLLWDEKESSNADKQRIVSAITHELSHQWFGDYVTLDMWSNIFLNEGFATYFEYHATDLFQANWDMPKQFVIEQLQPVLLTDSSGRTYPLSFSSNDPDVISSRFDDISYKKGGSILRMVHHLIGLENFKAGLSVYLDKGRWGSRYGLWSSFQTYADALPESQKLPDNVANVLHTWIVKAGYPLLTVELTEDGKSVTIIQERFLLTYTDDYTKWYVPITYTTSKNTNFTKTETQVWLTPDDVYKTIALNDADWILLNNQQTGYYRVEYDQKILDRLSDVLNDNVDTIDEISRAQLVDDQLNLARGNRKDYGEVLGFLRFLRNDVSYYSWTSAFNGLGYLLKRTKDAAVQKALKTHFRELSSKLVASVPLATPKPSEQIYTLKQVLAHTWACNLDDSDCVKTATQQFVDYTKDDTKKPNPNLRSLVYCNGLRNSENASADFDFLWEKYVTSDLATEKITILKALGCSKDDTVRLNYLKKALTSDVRLQDYSYVFSSVYSNNPDGVNVVIQFLKQSYKNFAPHFGSQSQLISLVADAADCVTSQEQIDQLNDFLKSEDLDVSIKIAGTEAVVKAVNNLKVIESLENSLKIYFKLNPSSASMTTVNLALILAVYLLFNFY